MTLDKFKCKKEKPNILSRQHFPLRMFPILIVVVLISNSVVGVTEYIPFTSDSKSTYPASVLGYPSIIFTSALPRVGFPIWGFPPPGFRVANFAWHYPLSKPNLLGCSKLKPYLSTVNGVSKKGVKDSCLVTVAASFLSPPFLQMQPTPLQSVAHKI